MALSRRKSRTSRSAVVGTRVAPGSGRAVVLVEVDAALVVLRPAVEAPEVEIGWARGGCRRRRGAPRCRPRGRRRTRALRSSGCAVRRLHRERVGRVVAPRAVAGELEGRHQLDGADAQLAQVAEALAHPLERTRATVHALAEGAHVQLVDDQVVPGRGRGTRPSPQSKAAGSYTTALPTELVSWRARGSMRESSSPPARTRNRYSSPGRASVTSADQVPPSSGASGTRAVGPSRRTCRSPRRRRRGVPRRGR